MSSEKNGTNQLLSQHYSVPPPNQQKILDKVDDLINTVCNLLCEIDDIKSDEWIEINHKHYKVFLKQTKTQSETVQSVCDLGDLDNYQTNTNEPIISLPNHLKWIKIHYLLDQVDALFEKINTTIEENDSSDSTKETLTNTKRPIISIYKSEKIVKKFV